MVGNGTARTRPEFEASSSDAEESPPPYGLDEEPEWEPQASANRSEESTPRSSAPVVIDVQPSEPASGLGPRRGSTRRRTGDEVPELLDGQVATPPVSGGFLGSPAPSPTVAQPAGGQGGAAVAAAPGPHTDLEGLGLPTEPDAIVRYLTHRYKGVGDKTAEALVERFGSALFTTLRDDPDAVVQVIPAGRAEQLIEAWKTDFARRVAIRDGGAAPGASERNGGRGRGRGRSRGRSRG
jgi:hypothetical protein